MTVDTSGTIPAASPLVARWVVPPAPEPGQVSDLVAATSLPRPLAALLIQRGFGNVDAARRFLRPSLDQLPDPYALVDMARAVETIAAHHRGGIGDSGQRRL